MENKVTTIEERATAMHYIRTFSDTAREPFIILDLDLKVIGANAAFLKNFRVSKEETENRFIYDLGARKTQKLIKILMQAVDQEEILVLDIDRVIFRESLIVFTKFAEHTLSLTDASIYVLCKQYKIDEVFTLDSDFKKVGLKVSN